MTPDQSPFPPGWMGTDLPGGRACDGTYCYFEYDSLPPVDESLFRGQFQWLPPLAPDLQTIVEIHRQTPPDKLKTQLDRLITTAGQMGLTLPAPFLAFMGNPERRDQIPSCTACYFDLPDRIVKSPLGEEAYLIRFLNDQQGVLFWYLYLTPQGQEAVLVSNLFYDEDVSGFPIESVRRATAFCAPSFEAFLYRFWLENSLWFGLDGGTLADVHQRYLAHYIGSPPDITKP
jgi:hypothetical protein